MSRRPRLPAAAALGLGLVLTGCVLTGAPGATAPDETRTLTVFAAASLKATFTDLGERFEAAHPGVTVAINFAGSQTLVEQLDQGATADVLATADEATMAAAVAAGLVTSEPIAFVANQLTIVVPPGNPAGVTGFADLADPGLKLVVCAPVVPCGAATQQVAQTAGVALTPVSEEQAVSDVLAKVQAGEADAGLVYATDARAATGTVEEVSFPESAAVTNRYPIAVLAAAADPELAAGFLDLVTGPQGRAVFERAGFRQP